MHTRGTLEINGTAHVLLHADDLPHELARCFAKMSGQQQAEFFSWLKSISDRWSAPACFQWRDMVDAMDAPARSVFAGMADEFSMKSWRKPMSDEVKHTPGSWRLDFNGGSMRVLAVGGQESVVAQGLGDPSIPEYLADARLIAAAPEMLEALMNLENDGGSGMPYSAWKLVQAAICKATGRTEWKPDAVRDGEPA